MVLGLSGGGFEDSCRRWSSLAVFMLGDGMGVHGSGMSVNRLELAGWWTNGNDAGCGLSV